MAIKDINGQKFGRLTALYKLNNYHKKGNSYWLCVCDCGNLVEVARCHLISGKIQSCKCLRNEINTKHGKHNTKLYQRWCHMKARSYNVNNSHYKYYGARGIAVYLNGARFTI